MEPAELSKQAIDETLNIGSDKDGCDDSWMEKGVAYHSFKAIRHATNALMMYSGVIPNDGEGVAGHVDKALTRLAMVRWLLTYREPLSPHQPIHGSEPHV